ncbi:MAG: hypothetical protein WBI29_03265 [Candidatus Saccharimonadales bacterium]
MKKKIVIAILAIALLSVGAFVGSLTLGKASAQTSTPTTEVTDPAATPAPAVTVTEDDDDAPFGRGLLFGIGGDDSDVAEKLGKTVEEMTAARTAALEKAVADAVTAGVITQTQADGIKADGYYGWGQLVRLAGEDYASTLDQDKYFAEALGVTVEALNQARADVRAEQLAAAVEAGTITQEQADLIAGQQALANSETFQADVRTSLQAAIQQAVTDGIITQTQADALTAQLENQNTFSNMFGFGEGMFGGRMGSMMGGMMSGLQIGNRNGMMGELAEGLQNGMLGRMFGGNQNGTSGGVMGGRQNGQGTCDGTCNQTNP